MTNTNLSAPIVGPHTVQVLKAPDALVRLEIDLRHRSPAFGWAYLLDTKFCSQLFLEHLTHSHLSMIVDNRQARHARTLVDHFPNFHAYCWSYNRTLHAKTFLFPHLAVTWITSYNLTVGSYSMSYNHAVRIDSPQITADLMRDWLDNAAHLKQIPHRKISGQSAS
jgi:hypothetical protein